MGKASQKKKQKRIKWTPEVCVAIQNMISQRNKMIADANKRIGEVVDGIAIAVGVKGKYRIDWTNKQFVFDKEDKES